jgi:hypothetical protein
MADNPKCQVCEDLAKAMADARRSVITYRPFLSSDRRSKSRWFKDDKRALEALKRASALAENTYHAHLSETGDRRD